MTILRNISRYHNEIRNISKLLSMQSILGAKLTSRMAAFQPTSTTICKDVSTFTCLYFLKKCALRHHSNHSHSGLGRVSFESSTAVPKFRYSTYSCTGRYQYSRHSGARSRTAVVNLSFFSFFPYYQYLKVHVVLNLTKFTRTYTVALNLSAT